MTGEGIRRLVHAGSAVVLLLAPLHSWTALRVVLTAGVPLVLLLELVRLRVPALAGALAARLPVFRPREARGVSGAVWLWIGYAIASWLPPPAAVGGILVGALADPAAALVGSRWGRGAPKSWQGTAAVIGVAAVALVVAGFGWPGVLVGAVAAGVIERWPGPLDDNLVVPPGVAAVVWLLA